MLRTAPEPVDVQDLQFKLRCRIKIFDSTDATTFSKSCNLVACASRFGLIFVGTNTTIFQAIQLKHLEEYSKSDGDKSDYSRRNISLPSLPKHLSVNCEHTILAVVVEKSGCSCALFYDVKSFWQQNLVQLSEVRLSPTPGVHVIETNWNPTLGAIFTACKSDGTLGIYEIKNTGIDINELPAAAGVTSFSWSPKGKQIAVGSRDGKITQYKPDLKAVKVINAPPLKEPHSLISLQWVSNYQFIGVFQPANPNNQCCLIVTDAPKTGDPIYMNYDDICYSNGNVRPNQFYMILQQNWNILMVASSNSMEVGILGNSGESWTQWIMGDASRAELPLSSDHQETLPIGFGLDIGNTQPLPWGESTLPPCPFLLLLSHYGTLCCFNIINLKAGVPSICAPPDPISDTSGLQHFITNCETGNYTKEQQNTPAVQLTVQLPKLTQPQTTKSAPQITASPVFEIKTSVSSNKLQGFSFSTTQSSNLFDGQATLIPVASGNKNTPSTSQSLYPSLPYQSLYPSLPNNEAKGITSHPIQVSTPSINISSASKATVSQATTSTPTPKTIQPKLNEEVSKTEIIHTDLKAEEEAEALFAQMVKEECIFLESGLKAVLHQGKSLKLNLGTEDEKVKLVDNTKLIQDFFKELSDLCMTQNAEVHILKQNLLQSWAWCEEVKSRYEASKDESVVILLRAQPLDSASEKQLEDIRHANYYLESQIAQAHRALDEQWESFQDYCKKTHKMQIPTMEMIFQTMVKQNAILKKQSYVLKDVSSRIKSKCRSALGSSLLIPLEDTADLTDELKRLRLSPEDICQIQCERVVTRMKNFTKKKTNSLRTFLKKRECSHISAVKPNFSSSSIIQASPSTKLKQLSTLSEIKTSPVVNQTVLRRLNFVQSTPKPVIVKLEATPSSQTSNTPIEGLQNFALKFEAKNFNKPAEKTFTPLTKSGIASSPNSAFVSTSFGSVASTSFGSVASTLSTTSSPFKPVIFGTTATTTTLSFVKTSSIVTAASTDSQPVSLFDSAAPKPFSFATTSAPTILPQTTSANVMKPGIPTFASPPPITTTIGSMAKPTFSFSLPSTAIFKTAVTSAPTLGKTETKNVPASKSILDPVASKSSPTIVSTLNLTSTTKSAIAPVDISVKTTSATSFAFGSPVSSTVNATPFASTSNTSSVFSSTTEKTNAISTAAPTKPFMFSSVGAKTTAPTTVTTSNRFAVSVGNVSNVASTSIQSFSFVTPTTAAVDNTKNISDSLPASVTITPIITTKSQPISTVSSSLSFVSTPPTTVTKPIFGNFTSPQQTSIFGSNTTVSSTQSTTPVTKPSIFGTAVVSQSFSVATIPSVSTPATNTVPSTEATPATSPVSSATTSAVSTTVTIPTPAVGTTSLNVFGTSTNSQQSIFGSPVTTSPQSSTTFVPSTSTNLVFGNASPTKSAIFGNNDLNTNKTLIFGSTPSSSPSTVVFGAATTPHNVTQSLSFGSTSTSQAPIFGGPATTNSQSIFGNVPVSSTTQAQGFGIFGDSSQKTSIFGSVTSTNTTQPSVFGTSSQTPIFGGTATSAASAFGQNTSVFDAPKSTQSIFGQSSGFGSTGSSFGSSSVFGSSAPAFGQTSGSIFGNPATTSSGSVFGSTPTTSSAFGSSGSVFGTPSSTTNSIFGSGGGFSTTTQPSTFAANASSGSFGFGSLNVGSTTTSSNTGFGATPPNPFGGENKNVFGSPSGATNNSVFGTSSGSIFGGTSQSFGSSSFGSQPVFGQQSSFGQTAFGGSGTFGQQSPGPFSGGSSGTVAQSGFGGAPAFQKPSGFGSSPVFGSSPSFGSAPSFGGAPAFGSPPAFGSTSKVFGSGNTTFGASPSSQNTSFGNLANQPTVGFGNLAQQATNTPSPSAPFSGSSSFSSWR